MLEAGTYKLGETKSRSWDVSTITISRAKKHSENVPCPTTKEIVHKYSEDPTVTNIGVGVRAKVGLEIGVRVGG